MGEEGRSEEVEEEVRPAEGEWRVVAVAVGRGRGMWERRGLEAANSPVVLLVEVRVREVRGEEGGSEKGRRMRREMEGQTEVRELLALEESRGGEL